MRRVEPAFVLFAERPPRVLDDRYVKVRAARAVEVKWLDDATKFQTREAAQRILDTYPRAARRGFGVVEIGRAM